MGVIYFVSGERCNAVLYCLTLTQKEAEAYAEKMMPGEVNEVYEVKQDELQFYCIDERIHLDTEKKEELARKVINK